MAPRDLEAEVKVSVDARDAERNLSKTQRAFKRFNDGLKASFAATAAAVGAVVVAVDQFRKAGEQLRSARALAALLDDTGVSASDLVSTLREASDQTISFGQATQAATRAIAQGLAPEQLVKLIEVATAQAAIFGTTTENAFNLVTSAIARQEAESLEALGISIKVGQANEAYAESLGKTADSLTVVERQTAFYNAVLEQSGASIAAAENAQGDLLRSYERTSAELSNLVEGFRLWGLQLAENALAVTKAGEAAEESNSSFLKWLGTIDKFINPLRLLGLTYDQLTEKAEDLTKQALIQAEVDQLRIAQTTDLNNLTDEQRLNIDRLVKSGLSQEAAIQKIIDAKEREIRITNELVEANSKLESQLEELGIVIKDEVAEELEKLADLEEDLSEAYREGRIEREELERGLKQITDRRKELKEATEDETEAVIENAAAIDRDTQATRANTQAKREAAQVLPITARAFDDLARSIGEAAAVEQAIARGAAFGTPGSSNVRLNFSGGGSRLVSRSNLSRGSNFGGGVVTVPNSGRTLAESRWQSSLRIRG